MFGHDHVGHGASQGKRAYIEDVDHYVDDVIEHCSLQKVAKRMKKNTYSSLKEKHPNLPLFLIGHSMGGMIAIRVVVRYPKMFQGMILNGPLVIPGPQVKCYSKISAQPQLNSAST